MMKRFLSVLSGLAAALVVAPATQAGVYTITDDNSMAMIDTDTQAGMFEWTVDGKAHLFQQWFWYRVGTTGREHSVDSLQVDVAGTTDTNFDFVDDTFFVRYKDSLTAPTFSIEIRFGLDGGLIGSRISDIAETITVTNLGTSKLDISVFQYSDFDLNADPTTGDDATPDVVQLINSNTVRQTDTSADVTIAETVVTPAPNRFELADDGSTLANLNDGDTDNLRNLPVGGTGTVGPGDVTWAFQWDMSLSNGQSFQISKDKQIRIPAPGAALLGALGLGVVSRIRRRLA